jgi:hypothetical protein
MIVLHVLTQMVGDTPAVHCSQSRVFVRENETLLLKIRPRHGKAKSSFGSLPSQPCQIPCSSQARGL